MEITMQDKNTTPDLTASKDPGDYRSYPALAGYIKRIGAEQLNFRKFIVREWSEHPDGRRYYTERVTIKIDAEGNLTCSAPSPEQADKYAPTPEEAADIKIAIKEAVKEWPESTTASFRYAELQRQKLGIAPENWFVCPDLARDHVLWCQVRKETASGDKDYYPWSFWNDGEWRNMEPDGLLPFWKPPERRLRSKIMVHEGAKAARAADLIPKDHPWYEKLIEYEHWGMMGGALASQRADYDELRKARPDETVYVCDCDPPGERALQKVSKNYRGSLIGVRFDSRWEIDAVTGLRKLGWDMADPMPRSFFEKNEHGVEVYIGPSLEELMVPATWAVDIGETGKRGRPPFILRQVFRDEWVHVITPEAFIHKRWPSRVYFRAAEFNDRVAPYSHGANVAQLLLKADEAKVEFLTYSPAVPAGIIAGPPRAFNTHQPSSIRPQEGDAKPWEDYLEHLIVDEIDRTEVIRWCATLVCRLQVKMLYGLLLVSETQGVGKTTLADAILAPLIGEMNVSRPTVGDISDGQFTGWKAHTRLVIVNEIYQDRSARTYNRLKDYISDRKVRVNKKHIPEYEVDNSGHVVAASNYSNALKLPGEDRRWLVPGVTESKRPVDYWRGFYNWLATGGLSIIRWWLEDWLTRNQAVMRGAEAPDTKAKRQMIQDSWWPWQECLARWLDELKADAEGKPIVVSDRECQERIKQELYNGMNNERLETLKAIRQFVKRQLQWYVAKDRCRLSGRSSNGLGYLISNDPEAVKKSLPELQKEGVWIHDGRDV
jgi:hypothetical protein